ncbi:MAG: hypothetical protein IH845_02355 [Nanoarchaeota archaeon]|nr:hypothetical protein [Nanoarchaeota archaeon]
MEMKLIQKTNDSIRIVADLNISLANAIRRSVNEIPILAIDEVDIYKNDSALYDEIIAHRLGLVVLKNQKIKGSAKIEMKMKAKCKGDQTKVVAGMLGDLVVHPETLIVLIDEGKEIELVARAAVGKGIDHAKYSPGVIFYKHLPKIKISGGGEKQTELAEIYPEIFEMFGNKLKVRDATAGDIDMEDILNYPGIEIDFDNNLVIDIESWGQINSAEVFTEACKALKANLSKVLKAIK